MEIIRSEIVKGVWLDCIPSGGKSSFMSINLLYSPDRDSMALNGLLPYVLCCGTSQYSSPDELAAVKSQLGDITLSPLVRRFGEVYSCGIKMDIPEKCSDVKSAVSLLCNLLISPATKGGLLLRENVDAQKEFVSNIVDEIENDYIKYSSLRCLNEMCCYEDYCVPYFGESSEISSVYYTRLTKHYRSILQTSPIEIVYCGDVPAKQIKRFLREALSVMPRGEINYEIGSDIRMNAVEDSVRISAEYDEESRCRYALGCRLGECMEDPDFPAIALFGSVLSILAQGAGLENVISEIDMHKGLLLISFDAPAGKENDYLDCILNIIKSVPDSLDDNELLHKAAQTEHDRLCRLEENSDENENFLFSSILLGLDCSASEFAQAVLESDKASVISVSQSLEPDMFTATGIHE